MKTFFAYVLILAVSVLLTGCVTISPMVDASSKNDVKAIKALLDNGANVNELWFGSPPLFWAAGSSAIDAAKLLIDRGADVNLINDNGMSPLGAAASFGDANMAKLLIQQGADIDRAIAGLERQAARFESLASEYMGRKTAYSSDSDPGMLAVAASARSGIRLLERLQRARFPEVQLLQIVPTPSANAQPVPVVGGTKTPTEQGDATQKLLDAKKLLDANIITKEEFEAIKKKLLPSLL